MNSDYEIEFNALRARMEEIIFALDRILGSFLSVLKNSLASGSVPDTGMCEYITEREKMLEFEVLRFIVEHKPASSDLRSLLVFFRTGKKIEETAKAMERWVNQFRSKTEKSPFGISSNLLDIGKQVRNLFFAIGKGVVDEDPELIFLRHEADKIRESLENWNEQLLKKAEKKKNISKNLVLTISLTSQLDLLNTIADSLIDDLLFMVTGGCSTISSHYAVVALE